MPYKTVLHSELFNNVREALREVWQGNLALQELNFQAENNGYVYVMIKNDGKWEETNNWEDIDYQVFEEDSLEDQIAAKKEYIKELQEEIDELESKKRREENWKNQR